MIAHQPKHFNKLELIHLGSSGVEPNELLHLREALAGQELLDSD